MPTIAQRRSRPKQIAGQTDSRTLVPPSAFLSRITGSSDNSTFLVDWAAFPESSYESIIGTHGSGTAGGSSYGGAGTWHSGSSYGGSAHAASPHAASGMSQSLASAAELVGLMAYFGGVVISIASLASAQIAGMPERRILSDDDVEMFDQALRASSKFKYDIIP